MKTSTILLIGLALVCSLSTIAKAQLFRDGTPPSFVYSLPNGCSYISHDHCRTWQIITPGKGELPDGLRHLPVRFPVNRTYTKYGVDYISYNGGRNYWRVDSTEVPDLQPVSAVESHSTPSIARIKSLTPNPSGNDVKLILGIETAENLSITICDENGITIRSVFSGEVNSREAIFPINATGLASGHYLVCLRDSHGRQVVKWVIEH